MRRMFNNFAVVLSLVLCAAAAAWLTANPWLEGSFGRTGSDHSAYARFHNGTVSIYFHQSDAGETPHWFWGAWKTPIGFAPGQFRWATLGFGHGIGGTSGGNVVHVWNIPDWFLIVLFAVWPAIYLIRRLSRKKRAPGMCPACGYDLRATPERCPECGAVTTGGGLKPV